MDGTALINDGFTLDGKVPARGRLHPQVNFKYRPASPEEVYEFQRVRYDRTSTGKEIMKAVVRLLVTQVAEWDIQQGTGDGATRAIINEVSLRKVPHDVLEGMIEYVTGYTAAEQAEDEKN